MPGPLSNAVATITVQDQDLLSPGFNSLVQRLSRVVTFPVSTNLVYSGYTTVTTAITTLINGITVPFLYAANVGNQLITMNIQSAVDAAARTWELMPGAVFMTVSPVVQSAGVNSGVQFFSVSALAPAALEYLYAY